MITVIMLGTVVALITVTAIWEYPRMREALRRLRTRPEDLAHAVNVDDGVQRLVRQCRLHAIDKDLRAIQQQYCRDIFPRELPEIRRRDQEAIRDLWARSPDVLTTADGQDGRAQTPSPPGAANPSPDPLHPVGSTRRRVVLNGRRGVTP